MFKMSKLKKRIRIITKRWRRSEEIEILKYLRNIVQSNMELEKPMASLFYGKMIKELNFSNTSVIQIKNKVRNLRQTYTKAVEWKNNNVQEVSSAEVQDNVLRICEYWDILEEIFGSKTDCKSKVIAIDPFASNSNSPLGTEFVISEVVTMNSEDFNFPEKTSRDKSENILSSMKSKYKKLPSNQDLQVIPQKNKIESRLIEELKLAKEQLEFEKLKQDEIICKLNREFQLAKDKLEFEKEYKFKELQIKEKEIELKKSEIDSNQKIRILELEKDERIEKMKIEYEFRFKIEVAKAKQINSL